MRVSVIGCGHLGIPHAVAMAELGHTVIGIDTDHDKVSQLNNGHSPIHEVGLTELIGKHTFSGNLRFTTDISEAADCDIHFLAVGTPATPTGNRYDTSQLVEALHSLAAHLRKPCIVVGKSTVSPGTAHVLAELLAKRAPVGKGAELAWNPEFLREGHAVEDTLHPDRIVIGVPSPRAERAIREVYAGIIEWGTPLFVTDLATAEMVKSAANAFLAMKISFINGVADMCRRVGADAVELAEAIGTDPRIGTQGMRPGPGFGGGCLPKDLNAFASAAEDAGALDLADLAWSVERVNSSRADVAVEMIEDALESGVEGARVALWGAAFKAGTNDVRESPALHLADRLTELGATVRVYDPKAMPSALRSRPGLRTADSMESSVVGADIVVVATEWSQFATANPLFLARRASSPLIVDLRNILNAPEWRRAGWTVCQLGRAA